jgi:hypothetical protein
MNFYKSDLTFVTVTNKESILPIYFSQNSQDAIYQIKSYYHMGYKLTSNEHKRTYLGGKDLNEISLETHHHGPSWSRNIISYKSMMSNITQVENDLIFE